MAINASTIYTDMVNLESFIIDLNSLEAARIEADPLGESLYGVLLMKSGHIHTISVASFNKLKEYCRPE